MNFHKPKITEAELQIFRNMKPADKFRLICDMHMQARAWKKAALQTLHKDWTPEQVDQRVREVFFCGTD